MANNCDKNSISISLSKKISVTPFGISRINGSTKIASPRERARETAQAIIKKMEQRIGASVKQNGVER